MGICCCKDEDEKKKINKEEQLVHASKFNTRPYIPANSEDMYHTRPPCFLVINVIAHVIKDVNAVLNKFNINIKSFIYITN